MRAKRKTEKETERGWGEAFQSGEEGETLQQLFPQQREENLLQGTS